MRFPGSGRGSALAAFSVAGRLQGIKGTDPWSQYN
jgi:hypothetical protein